jgi:hypothetical protein
MPAQSSRRRRGSGAGTDNGKPATSEDQPTEETEAAASGGTEQQGTRAQVRMSRAAQDALRRKLQEKFH